MSRFGVDAAAAPRERRDEQRRAEPGDESDAGRSGRGHAGKNGDRDRGRGGGAHAGEIRIDERIAQHALQHRSAERQRRADGCADADARQAQLPDDRVEDTPVRADARARRRSVARRKRRAADQQARAARGDREQRRSATSA